MGAFWGQRTSKAMKSYDNLRYITTSESLKSGVKSKDIASCDRGQQQNVLSTDQKVEGSSPLRHAIEIPDKMRLIGDFYIKEQNNNLTENVKSASNWLLRVQKATRIYAYLRLFDYGGGDIVCKINRLWVCCKICVKSESDVIEKSYQGRLSHNMA